MRDLETALEALAGAVELRLHPDLNYQTVLEWRELTPRLEIARTVLQRGHPDA